MQHPFELEQKILYRSRVEPKDRRARHKIPLSILDSTVGRYTPTQAVWLFDSPDGAPPPRLARADEQVRGPFYRGFKLSFIETLEQFPQFSAALSYWPNDDTEKKKTKRYFERYRRLVCNLGENPGVEWTVVAHRDVDVADLSPDFLDCLPEGNVWDANTFPAESLLSATPLASFEAPLADAPLAPAMTVRISFFRCGGYAVGIRVLHALADAQTLLLFVKTWAATCAARNPCYLRPAPPKASLPVPLFDPALLDSHAGDDLDASSPNLALVHIARALPMYRFDGWAVDAHGITPSASLAGVASLPPRDLFPSETLSSAVPPPWPSWDAGAPVAHTILFFTESQIDALRSTAANSATNSASTATTDASSPHEMKHAVKTGHRLSRTDFLIAHIWRLVARARNFADTPAETLSLDVTVSVRQRVSPPLPEGFCGAPFFLAHVDAEGQELCGSLGGAEEREIAERKGGGPLPLEALASRVRATLMAFDPPAVRAHLHDAAFEASPDRIWQGFLGRNHLVTSSWGRIGMYDVNFTGAGSGGLDMGEKDGAWHKGGEWSRLGKAEGGGGKSVGQLVLRRGGRPRFAHANMPNLDGFVQHHEAGETGTVQVSLHLERGAMERLLVDPELFG